MINLTRLELNGNDIDTIEDISELTNLNKLGLACTYITDLIPISKMHKLKILDLGMVPIEDIDIIFDLNIEDLDIRNTNIVKKDISKLKSNISYLYY